MENQVNQRSEASSLESFREQIDSVDREILRLFEKRMEISEGIARVKSATGRKVYDKEREAAKLAQMQELAHGDFNKKAIRELFRQLMGMSRRRQYAILEQGRASGRTPFIEVPSLDRENIRVVYQGVEGAYSHAALQAYFGEGTDSFHVRKFRDAMEAIADGSADYAVLPIENTTAGIVADNFDLLSDFENYIVAQQIIPVEHVLMAAPGTRLEEIQNVYSHPQALSQCEGLFHAHPEWRAVAFDNTALAARKISLDQRKDQAAIGSAFAARLFGLEILKEHVNDMDANATRFMIVTNQRVFVKGARKITICLELPHSAGTLHNILSNFIYNDVNMTHIESRPIKGRNWEYRFFIDFEGNLNDESVRSALRGIRQEAISMRILGNY
jgi:chorismate mutase/prephenate dehydratase